MKRTALLPILTLLCFLPVASQVTVWPGDANNNGIANHVDLLYVGLAHGAMGPIRDSLGNITWVPNQNTSIWQQSTPNGVEYAYIDCNGSGFIDNMDTSAIEQNYDETHGVVVPDTGLAWVQSSPTLSLDFSQDSILLFGDTTILVNILLGDSGLPIDSIYGLAFTIEFDSSAVDSAFFNLQGGFLASSSSVLSLGKVKKSKGKIEMAITRVNHVNAVGAGAIGSIGIVMDDNLRTSQYFEVGLKITDVVAFAAGGSPLALRPIGDTLAVNTPTTSREQPLAAFEVHPIPANNWLRIHAPDGIDEARLYDLTGKRQRTVRPSGHREAIVDVRRLPAGVYLLSVRTGDAWVRKKVLVQ